MHEIEGANPATISGHLAYKDTDPPTDLVAYDMNAVYRGLMRLVLDSGVGLADDGADDQSEGWDRILKSVRRLAMKHAQTVITIIGSTYSLTPSADVNAYIIREASSHASALISLDTDPTHIGRLLIFQNDTTSDKLIRVNVFRSVLLKPNRVVMMYASNNSTGTAALWEPVDGATEGQLITVAARLRNVAVPAEFTNFNLIYMRQGRSPIVTLIIPSIAVVLASPATQLEIVTPAGAGFDDDLFAYSGSTDSVILPGFFADNVPRSVAACAIQFNPNTNKIQLNPCDGVSFNGTVAIQKTHLNYYGKAQSA